MTKNVCTLFRMLIIRLLAIISLIVSAAVSKLQFGQRQQRKNPGKSLGSRTVQNLNGQAVLLGDLYNGWRINLCLESGILRYNLDIFLGLKLLIHSRVGN